MKWINDQGSVSEKELRDNWLRAEDAYDSIVDRIYVLRAADYATRGLVYEANESVDAYFKETGEDREDYLKALSGKTLPQFKADILSSRPSTVYHQARKGPVIVQRCSTNGDVQEEYVVISRKLWNKRVK
tara:strand:- start:727 stop:1116 length:390 start_codon:yes stop_codon:yes gene_type:complete